MVGVQKYLNGTPQHHCNEHLHWRYKVVLPPLQKKSSLADFCAITSRIVLLNQAGSL